MKRIHFNGAGVKKCTVLSSAYNFSICSIGGATPKFLGGPNLRPTTDVIQAIYGITHNSGIGDKQKSCVMCVKFSKE